MKLSRPKMSKSVNEIDDFLASEDQNHRKTYFVSQRENALQIQNSMEDELSKVARSSTTKVKQDEKFNLLEEYKLRHSICNQAFDQIIDLHSESRALLAEIRSEYEVFLNVLVQGENQYHFIYEQLKKVTTDPVTLALLRKRRDELEKKISILNESNQRIANQILKISQNDGIWKQQANIPSNNQRESSSAGGGTNNKSDRAEQRTNQSTKREFHSIISAVTLPGATDVQKLSSHSSKIQARINKLSNSLKSQYTSKQRQIDLKEQFCKKENIQHHLLLYNAKLKERFENLKLSIESIRKTRTQSNESLTMLGAVKKALENHRGSSSDIFSTQGYENEGIFEDDDPANKRNEERLMDYIDTFNEMISAKEYEQAAKHAANSPKAILRTYDIMKIFNDVEEDGGGVSPQMFFCEALMATADSSPLLSGALSCEVIKCALANQRIDLASYWLSKDCFKLSLPLANIFLEFCKCDKVCVCGGMTLAKEIFHKLGAHRQASLCLLSTGKIHQMIQYGKDHNFTVHDYMFLCKRFPSTKLLLFLVSAHPEVNIPGLISFPYAVSVLLDSENSSVLLELLKEIHQTGITSVDSTRNTFTELLFAETKDDQMTNEKWLKVVDFCTSENLNEIAEDLLAVVTVREALDTAAYKCILDYIS